VCEGETRSGFSSAVAPKGEKKDRVSTAAARLVVFPAGSGWEEVAGFVGFTLMLDPTPSVFS
jgi:hypothetical protein